MLGIRKLTTSSQDNILALIMCSRTGIQSFVSLANSVLIDGSLSDLPFQQGQNATYSLSFRAPQLSCQRNVTKETVRGMNSTTDDIPGFDSQFDTRQNRTGTFRVTSWRYKGLPVADKSVLSEFGVNPCDVEIETTTLACTPHTMLYDLRIQNVNGIQSVTYTVKDPKPLTNPDAEIWTWTSNSTTFPEYERFVANMNTKLESWYPYSILDVALASLGSSWTVWMNSQHVGGEGICGIAPPELGTSSMHLARSYYRLAATLYSWYSNN